MLIIDRSGGVSTSGFGNSCNKVVVLVLLLSFFSLCAKAEPWLDTGNAPLRADIEQLSRAGVIRVPINTWPLMWAAILNDLEHRQSAAKALSQELQNSLARVLKAGQRATRVNHSHQSLSLSVANQSQLLRQFGDSSRKR
ncbi:hypothetical protein N8456_07615 [Porticoccaceae bacterium]|nr:hypothetical protein [Porticoccaceae bacterium]